MKSGAPAPAADKAGGFRAPSPASAPRDILVIVNPASRYSQESVVEPVRAAAAARSIPCRFAMLPKGSSISTFLDQELANVAAGPQLTRVIAAGGDGTVGSVADAIARREETTPRLELAILPCGTANVLARELGLPTSIPEAVAVAVGSDQTIEVDAIEVAGRHVFTQVGVGPDAVMIRDTPRESQVKLGRWAYLLTFVRRVVRTRPRGFFLTVDGDRVPAAAWQVVVANAGTLGAPPFTWGPRIDPTDGVLDICLYDVRSVGETFGLLWRFTLGRHRKGGNTRFLRAHRDLIIESDRPLLVQGDGEIVGRTPITLRLVPRAVPIVVARTTEPAAVTTSTAPAAAVAVTENVEAMMAQHSRTWVLQGPRRHPIAAIEALDAALFLRVNALPLGRTADRVLGLASRLMHYGEGWGAVVVGIALADPKNGMRVAIEVLPVLWLTMLIVNFPLKHLFRRRRPFLAYVKARVVGPRPQDFSLPSGHSAAAFAGAFLLSAHVPFLAPLFYVIAVIVALSRIYLGVHYPSDVVFGAAVGTVLAALFRAAFLALAPAWLGSG